MDACGQLAFFGFYCFLVFSCPIVEKLGPYLLRPYCFEVLKKFYLKIYLVKNLDYEISSNSYEASTPRYVKLESLKASMKRFKRTVVVTASFDILIH